MTHKVYADDLALLTNTSAQVESLLHSLQQVAKDIGLHVKANETDSCILNKKERSPL